MRIRTLFTLATLTLVPYTAAGQEPAHASGSPAAHLRDRGPGVATSMFGTYIRKGEWLVYPFFEYYRDRDFEYAPDEFGVAGNQDFRGRYRASEALFFVGYGITDNLAFEMEVATIRDDAPDRHGDAPLGGSGDRRRRGDLLRDGARRGAGHVAADDGPRARPDPADRHEREVALLLLKGLSVKEIAAVRATSERTIRAQAAALYAKAGLSGRAALSAFFLEDLLAPIERSEAGKF